MLWLNNAEHECCHRRVIENTLPEKIGDADGSGQIQNSKSEERACKPDFVALLDADGHFSAAPVARSVVATVSRCNSSQPESSPGRVCQSFPLLPKFSFGLRFLLGLAPDGGCLSRRVAATLVRSYIKALRPAPFHPYSGLTAAVSFLWPAPAAPDCSVRGRR